MAGAPASVAVIGGGIAGLTTAYRLLQRGLRVSLFEAGPSPGGLVRTFEVNGEPLECFYHHLFPSDAAAVALIDELGLSDRLVWRPARAGVFYSGRVYPFTTPLDLLRFTPIGVADQLRLGLAALYLRRRQDGSRFEEISAMEWLRRYAGRRALDVVWAPLLRAKFGDLADRLVMTWLWHKLHLRLRSRGGPRGRERLGYLLGSFGALAGALAARIRALGGALHTGCPVRRIAPEGGGLALELDDGGRTAFDAVVATVANRVFQRIAPPLPEEYNARLDAVPHRDALCLVLALRRPLSDFYSITMNDPSVPFLAVIEHTNLVPPQRYGGAHIVYLANYVDAQSRLAAPHLRRLNPSFDESWVQDRRLFHGRDAQPVFTVGAGSRLPAHRTPLEGLYLANLAQVYPQDRGQNYAVLLGEAVAGLVAGDLSRRRVPQYQV